MVKGGEGSCTYAKKVENVKAALGYGAIIIDSKAGTNNLKYRHSERDKVILLLAS